MVRPSDFFDLVNESVAQFFADCEYVWQAVGHLAAHAARLTGGGQQLLGTVMRGAYIGDAPVYLGEGARIEPGAYVEGPAYIGAGAVVRHGAYVRANVIMLPGSLLGHASEAKNSLFLPGASAPHFNYVGDSILGRGVNLGAGTKLSNLGILSEKNAVTGKRPTITLTIDDKVYDTGLAKLGAILGDNVQTGCNAVLNPGCLVGRNTLVYANTSLRKGYHAANSIVKLRQTIRRIEKL